MDNKIKFIFLALIVIFLTSLITFHSVTTKAASSRTIVVPDDYTTIQAAVANASPGDNIYVKSGTYNGGILIDKPLSLMGENVDDTIISGGVVLNSLHIQLTANNLRSTYTRTKYG